MAAPQGPPVQYFQQGQMQGPPQGQGPPPGPPPGQQGPGNPTPPPPGPTPSMVSSSIPPGLEALIPLNQIFIKQQIDVLELFSGFEQANKYMLFNPSGQMIYMAEEDSECCQRQQCGSNRSFVMNIRDPNGNGIMLDKPCHCILAKMTIVASSTGEVLGTIEEQCTCLTGARFNIFDGAGQLIFIIKAPFCTEALCGGNIDFMIVSSKDQSIQVGQITKTWAGFGQEMFTSADNFGISFPIDLSVKMKAVMVGACIIIDFKFYEDQHRGNNQNHHHHYY